METLLCQDCGHDIEKHHSAGCHVVVDYSTGCFCDCSLTGPHAQHAAQRAAAIAHLRHYGLLACKWRIMQTEKTFTPLQRDLLYKLEMDTMAKIFVMVAAYRAVGILRERKP